MLATIIVIIVLITAKIIDITNKPRQEKPKRKKSREIITERQVLDFSELIFDDEEENEKE